MKLQELLTTIPLVSPISSPIASITEITGISTNSHACQPGDLFIGLPGTRVDGGEFWRSALETGAVAAIISPVKVSVLQENFKSWHLIHIPNFFVPMDSPSNLPGPILGTWVLQYTSLSS